MLNPDIRFKDDSNNWEVKELKILCNPLSERKNNKNINNILSVNNKKGLILQNEQFEDREIASENTSNYKIVNKDNFAYNPARINVGSIAKLKNFNQGIISPMYVVFECKDTLDSNYFEQFTYTDIFKQQVLENLMGSVRLCLQYESFEKIKIPYVNNDIQFKISKFLLNIDSKITNEELLIKKLKDIKSSLLTKMFPQENTYAPKLRFKEFNEDWENSKVGNFLIESHEIGHKGDTAKKMTVKLWGKGVYKKEELGSPNTQYFIRHTNQFIYSKLDFLNSAFAVIPPELDNFETTSDVPSFNCYNINPYFMYYTAIQPNFYKKNGNIADGSRKAKRIYTNVFLNMPLKVPCLQEQESIKTVFNSLNSVLSLHERKLEKLKQIKLALLDKLLV